MYRSDREALQQRADHVSREADDLRRQNQALRAAVSQQPYMPPMLPPTSYASLDLRKRPIAERARLAAHTVTPFPVWAVGVLNVVTFGLFPLIHFGLMHDRMPRVIENDPSSGKAIGYAFIPIYSMYWMFFSALRLCDRLDMQLRLRNRPERAPRGLALTACIFTLIPYIGILALPILWTFAACFLQSTANKVAALPQSEWDATPGPYDAAPPHPGAAPAAHPGMPRA